MSRNRARKEFYGKEEVVVEIDDVKVVKKDDKDKKKVRKSGIERAIERMAEGETYKGKRGSLARLEAMLIEQQDMLTAYKVTLKDYEKRLTALEAKLDSEEDDSK